MKKNLLLLLLLSIAFNIKAQNQYFSITGGLNLANETNEYSQGIDPRMGFAGGINYGFYTNERISFETGLLYLQQGSKAPSVFIGELGLLQMDNRLTKHKFDYISGNIKMGYTFRDKILITPRIGVQPALLISAKELYPTYVNGIFQEYKEGDLSEWLNTFDLAALLEVELGYQFSEKMVVFTTLTGRRSLFSFNNHENSSLPHIDVYSYGVSNYKHKSSSVILGVKVTF